MIRHIVLFKFKESAENRTKQENLLLAKEKCLALKNEIPEICTMEVSFNVAGVDKRNFDFLIDSTFKTTTDLNNYQIHPAHKAFGDFIGNLRMENGRSSIDIEL